MMQPRELEAYLWELEHEITLYLSAYELVRSDTWKRLCGLLIAGISLGIVKPDPFFGSSRSHYSWPYDDTLKSYCDRITAGEDPSARIAQAEPIAKEFMDKYVSPEAKAFLKKE